MPAELSSPPLSEQILGVLRSADRPLLGSEIAARLGASTEDISTILNRNIPTGVKNDLFRWQLRPGSNGLVWIRSDRMKQSQLEVAPQITKTTKPRGIDSIKGRHTPQPFGDDPLEVPSASLVWATNTHRNWAASGRRGIAVASTRQLAIALLQIALEDHLTTAGATAAIVTTERALLLSRSLAAVFADVKIGGPLYRLPDSTITVYKLGADTVDLDAEARDAELNGPILLALLGCRKVRRRSEANHFMIRPQSALAIDFPGPLLELTRNLLTPAFGHQVTDRVVGL